MKKYWKYRLIKSFSTWSRGIYDSTFWSNKNLIYIIFLLWKWNCMHILNAKIFLKRLILFINLEKYNSIILQQQREYKVSIRPSNHGKDVLCHAWNIVLFYFAPPINILFKNNEDASLEVTSCFYSVSFFPECVTCAWLFFQRNRMIIEKWRIKTFMTNWFAQV